MLLVIDSFLSLLLYCVFNFMKAEDVLLLSTPLQNYKSNIKITLFLFLFRKMFNRHVKKRHFSNHYFPATFYVASTVQIALHIQI